MKLRGFTMTEILIVIVIIGILATIGIPSYQGLIANANAKVCQNNLKALANALDTYAMEHDVMPGDLSELPSGYIEKAYARILQEKGAWKIKLAYFIVGLRDRGLAYAGLLEDIARGNINLITCPADSDPPARGGRSYGINSRVRNLSAQDYRNLAGDTLIVGDCNSAEFQNERQLALVHRGGVFGIHKYAQLATKAHRIEKIGRHEDAVIPGGAAKGIVPLAMESDSSDSTDAVSEFNAGGQAIRAESAAGSADTTSSGESQTLWQQAGEWVQQGVQRVANWFRGLFR